MKRGRASGRIKFIKPIKRPPAKPRAPPSAAFLAALTREHNAPITPYLPRSVARIRAATFDPDSVKTPPNAFRSKRRRK